MTGPPHEVLRAFLQEFAADLERFAGERFFDLAAPEDRERLARLLEPFLVDDRPSVTPQELEAALDEAEHRCRVVEREVLAEFDPAGSTYNVWWEVSGLPGQHFESEREARAAMKALRLQIVSRGLRHSVDVAGA